MKYRVFAAFVLGVLVFNLGASGFVDTKARRSQSSQLVAFLPASDGVAVLDAKRFFGGALQQVLANNQPYLAKITGKLDQMQSQLGFDPRQFDELVVGASIRQVGTKNYDVDAVAIGRGQASSASLITAARATNSKHREERVGGRVIHIFDSKTIAGAKSDPQLTARMPELAVAMLDERTVAFGEPGRVRQTVEQKTRIGADLAGMLDRGPAAVATFAVKPPAGLKAYLPLENDELGKNIDSIRYIYGSADIAAGNVSVQVTARTQQNAQATSLYETLNGLKVLGKAFLGGAQSGNRAVYARLIEGTKFSVKANEVLFELSVPQSDIDVLVGALK